MVHRGSTIHQDERSGVRRVVEIQLGSTHPVAVLRGEQKREATKPVSTIGRGAVREVARPRVIRPASTVPRDPIRAVPKHATVRPAITTPPAACLGARNKPCLRQIDTNDPLRRVCESLCDRCFEGRFRAGPCWRVTEPLVASRLSGVQRPPFLRPQFLL